MVRVYDAKTGEFQWSGQLNLTPSEGSGAGRTISTVVPRRATITKIRGLDTAAQSPLFVLRAVDVSTGGILWEDEFSADGEGAAHARQTAARSVGVAEAEPAAADLFDFRIRMFDRDGRTVLWKIRCSSSRPTKRPKARWTIELSCFRPGRDRSSKM
jgi:hypothetical protein